MRLVAALIALSLAAQVGAAAGAEATQASRVAVVTGRRASSAELKVAGILADRLGRRSDIKASVIAEDRASGAAADLTIYIGLLRDHDALAALCAKNSVAPPTDRDPGPEGFALKTAREGDRAAVLAAGVDKRGVLYAAGEILRQITPGPTSITMPALDLRTAPAFPLRGSSAGQGGDMMEITKARPWTEAEVEDYTLELAFSGANTFYCSAPGAFYDFLKSLDLRTHKMFRPNQLDAPYPPEWQATERGGWVCPSIPEARAALHAAWEKDFAASPGQDLLRMYSGDPGGCRCPRCSPWGKTFMELCEEAAAIWHKYHPNSEIQVCPQDLDNAGDQAIFDYLNAKPRTWLTGVVYGPGTNAMSPYFRSEMRRDLFVYPGFGPVNRYLREMLNNLPPRQHLTHISDITHWISSQYQVQNPEPHLVQFYGRRTFEVRPRAYYSIFQSIMPFADGDVVYSECYDEFHQYMWNRLLWNPNRSLEDVMMEYARYYFGAPAAPDMVEAMLQFERNLETPLETNPGIDRYYLLVKSAGWNIPAHLMRVDHRWRLHMQKAALDKYIQLRLQRQLDLAARAASGIDQAFAARDADAALAAAVILQEPAETPDMAALRAEAGRLGEESNQIYGERDIGLFRTEQDFVGLDWMRKQVERAQAATGADRLQILGQMIHYEDPGPGGFYDDLGDRARQPHLANGQSYNARDWMDPSNRPSQSTIAYSAADGKGVTLRYSGLDPAARYAVRVTMVVPQRPGSDRWRGAIRQSVVANGTYLAREVEIPSYTARQFEYEIPQSLTKGGELELWLEKGAGGRATVASEVWLIKKPSEP